MVVLATVDAAIMLPSDIVKFSLNFCADGRALVAVPSFAAIAWGDNSFEKNF